MFVGRLDSHDTEPENRGMCFPFTLMYVVYSLRKYLTQKELFLQDVYIHLLSDLVLSQIMSLLVKIFSLKKKVCPPFIKQIFCREDPVQEFTRT